VIQRAPSHERKTYVIDTNVFLHDPDAIFKFEEHEVIVPIVVIEEIDRFKKELTETGRNARRLSRHLDNLRMAADRPLSEGVPVGDGGGTIRVDLLSDLEIDWPWADAKHRADNLILAVSKKLNEVRGGEGRVVVVTKDTNLRIKANALGVRAEDYEHGKVNVDEQYDGQAERTVPSSVIDALFKDGEADLDVDDLGPNECLVLRNEDRPQQTALARVRHGGGVQSVARLKEGVWGIFPRNKEQCFALDLLLDDDIKLVTLVGKAGTGKTLLAIAAGLKRSADDRAFHRLLVSRPIFPLGKDIGYLPGDVEEKLNPWMKPVYDNVEFLLESRPAVGRTGRSRGYQELMDQGLLEIEPLTYIRGRSIPHQYLIIDESQNLTPHEIKTIITRAGEGTKVVLTGDPYQIDNPYVDATSNGLVYVVEKFRGEAIAGHITLRKGERSDLAELAANLL